MQNSITGIVLSGGKGKRLGYTEKAFIKIRNTTLLEKKIQFLSVLCKEIIVVTNIPKLYQEKGFRLVRDQKKDQGPLMGLFSGLSESKSVYNFLTAIDMPFFDNALFEYTRSFIKDFDVVVPKINNKIEPLFGFYSTSCLSAIRQALSEKKSRVISFFDSVKVKYISEKEVDKFDLEKKLFFNINTKEDMEKAINL